ncbi:MAG: PIN domain-containing protein [archaeon]|nr:PIN domain-containing protein [archaeon]
MIDSKFIDSSVWVAYITKKLFSDVVDTEGNLAISVLSIFEIKRKLLREGLSEHEIESILLLVKNRCSFIFPVTLELAEKAAGIAQKNNLATVDSIIYTTAMEEGMQLFTSDNDFRGLKGAVVLG